MLGGNLRRAAETAVIAGYLSFDPRLCFSMNILGKQNELPFSLKCDRKKESGVISFTRGQNIICSQTQLDDIAHE